LEEKELVPVCFRIPRKLKELIEKYLTLDLHANQTEFFREALREKIQQDAPQLYKKLFEEKEAQP